MRKSQKMLDDIAELHALFKEFSEIENAAINGLINSIDSLHAELGNLYLKTTNINELNNNEYYPRLIYNLSKRDDLETRLIQIMEMVNELHSDLGMTKADIQHMKEFVSDSFAGLDKIFLPD